MMGNFAAGVVLWVISSVAAIVSLVLWIVWKVQDKRPDLLIPAIGVTCVAILSILAAIGTTVKAHRVAGPKTGQPPQTDSNNINNTFS